jgi:hypothetical protein
MRCIRSTKTLIVTGALALMCGVGTRPAQAQTVKIGNFDAASITGIVATLLSPDPGQPSNAKIYSFSLGSLANSTFIFTDGVTPAGPFHIQQIIGVYQVGYPGGNLGNAVGGGPVGWKGNGPSGGDGFNSTGNPDRINNGQTQAGTAGHRFEWLDPTTAEKNVIFGYHLQWLDNQQKVKTGFVYADLPAVPEPAFYQMSVFLAGGGLLVLRACRRRQA